MDAEALAARFMARSGRPAALRRILASDAVWRLSGLTYASAVVATTGRYLDVPTYVREMRKRMDRMRWFVPDGAEVLDLGTGIGGNLFGLSDGIARGVGLDINPFYIRRARRISRRLGATRLSFAAYDGSTMPELGPVNLVVAIGTFERVDRDRVEWYLRVLIDRSSPPRRFLLYFLTEAARDGGFGRVLGPGCYTFWSERQLAELFARLGLRTVRATPGLTGLGTTYFLEADAGAGPTGLRSSPRPAGVTAAIGSTPSVRANEGNAAFQNTSSE